MVSMDKNAEPPKKRQKTKSKSKDDKEIYHKTRRHQITLYHVDGFDCDTFDVNHLPTECPIVWPKDMQWGVCQIERAPTTGTLHVQGAVYFPNAVYPSHLIKHWGEKNHYEAIRGSVKQNFVYCSKSKTHVCGPWESGERPAQGARLDWSTISERSKTESAEAILLDYPHLAPCKKGIEALVIAHLPKVPLKRDMTVFYLWGPTEVGKSHRVYHHFTDIYTVKGEYQHSKSFDEYYAQSCLFLDEWDSTAWPLTLMNSLLDVWPCRLYCRYANRNAHWTTVVICSNHSPDVAYRNLPQHIRATFLRRITKIFHVTSQSDVVVFEK